MTEFDLRFPARTAERLLDVWIEHQLETGKINRNDMAEIPYIYTRKINWPDKIVSFLMAKFFHKKHTHSF